MKTPNEITDGIAKGVIKHDSQWLEADKAKEAIYFTKWVYSSGGLFIGFVLAIIFLKLNGGI